MSETGFRSSESTRVPYTICSLFAICSRRSEGCWPLSISLVPFENLAGRFYFCTWKYQRTNRYDWTASRTLLGKRQRVDSVANQTDMERNQQYVFSRTAGLHRGRSCSKDKAERQQNKTDVRLLALR